MSPRISSPAHPGGGGGTPAGRGRGRGAKRDMSLIGQTVKIVGGPFKGRFNTVMIICTSQFATFNISSFLSGHIGIVKDSTEDTARVELHTNCKTISVDKNRLSSLRSVTPHICHASRLSRVTTQLSYNCLCQPPSSTLPLLCSSGRLGNASARSESGKTPMHAGTATPMHGSQTPMYGSKTPMYGSQTPMHDGSRTPHYGSQTPLHEGGLGSSSRTPSGSNAWDPTSGNTPARYSIIGP